jgi:hypothetical protein
MKKEGTMGTINNDLAEKVKSLPDSEKIELVDTILMQIDKPDPEIDRTGVQGSLFVVFD